MSGSRGVMILGALLATAVEAQALDTARLDLLAGEAVSVMGGATAAGTSRTGLLVLLGIPLATMLSAFLGTFLGIRGLSFTSLRDNDGWREVAYRFRSDRPLTVGKDVIRRMSGVLDDIEELGARIRTRSEKPAVPKAAAVSPAAPTEPAAVSAPVRPPVTFARREEATAPAAVDARPTPPRPIARPEGREGDRSTRYRRARALLRDGHDRETVRSMTGLKLAEVDLLRCASAPSGGGS